MDYTKHITKMLKAFKAGEIPLKEAEDQIKLLIMIVVSQALADMEKALVKPDEPDEPGSNIIGEFSGLDYDSTLTDENFML